jgi:hypothetical protein
MKSFFVGNEEVNAYEGRSFYCEHHREPKKASTKELTFISIFLLSTWYETVNFAANQFISPPPKDSLHSRKVTDSKKCSLVGVL